MMTRSVVVMRVAKVGFEPEDEAREKLGEKKGREGAGGGTGDKIGRQCDEDEGLVPGGSRGEGTCECSDESLREECW